MSSPREIVVNGRFLGQRVTGVQRVSRELLAALDRLAGDGSAGPIRLACVVPDREAAAHFDGLGCRHTALEIAPGGSGHAWEQFTLPRHVRGRRLLCLGNIAPLVSLFSANPPAVMLHDQAHILFPRDYSPAYRLLHRTIEAAIIRRARPLLLVSEAERAQLAARHPGAAARAVVTPNGGWLGDDVPPAPLRPTVAEQPGYGLFVGSPGIRKNIDGILAVAVRLARDHGLPFHFVGPNADRLKDAVPAGLRHLIRLSGQVRDADLPDIYRRAAFLLYPSFYEASGLPPSEAMAFGCPVIVSDLPVMRERCGNAALYCDPRDHGAMAAAALRLLFDRNLASALRRRGMEQAARFTWRRQARQIVEAIGQADRAGSSSPLPSRPGARPA